LRIAAALVALGLLCACGGNGHKEPAAPAVDLVGPGGIACGKSASPPAASTSPWANKIAFEEGSEGLSLMNLDGTGVTRVFTGEILSAAWSPDGKRIAISASKDNNRSRAIYVLDDASSDAKQVTPDGRFDWSPTWSPDGKRLVFVSGPAGPGRSPDIYTVGVDGQGLTRLGEGGEPKWSPGGGCIAFESRRDGSPKIYVMAADGSAQTRLTNSTDAESDLAWSPDGRSLAYTCQAQVCVAGVNGANAKRLTTGVFAGQATWSPDGRRIAYLDGAAIYAVNADGSNPVRISNNNVINNGPSWSPDGRKIAFSSGTQCGPCPDGALRYNGVHAGNADGSSGGTSQTFVRPGFTPIWSPVARK
jgi:TolB protein